MKNEDETSQLAEDVDEFNAIVAPLEQRSGHRLNGPGRPLCLRAFRENPGGFRSCAARALTKAEKYSDVVGLLVRMAKDGDWDVPPPPPPADPADEIKARRRWEREQESNRLPQEENVRLARELAARFGKVGQELPE